MEIYSVNAAGQKYLRELLPTVAKHARDNGLDDAQISAYCAEIEASLDNGNGPQFEIRSFDSISGHTEVHDLEASMIDVTEHEED